MGKDPIARLHQEDSQVNEKNNLPFGLVSYESTRDEELCQWHFEDQLDVQFLVLEVRYSQVLIHHFSLKSMSGIEATDIILMSI